MKVRLTGKENRSLVPLPAETRMRVERYSWHVYGGPEEAEISVTGRPEHLRDLLFMLRNGLEIHDDKGVPLWWGYVSRVEVPINKVRIVADLEELANKVAIAYTMVNLGGSSTGVRRTTAWKEDQLSIEKYGVREMLDTATDLNVVAADALAQRRLNDLKLPRGYILNDGGADTAVLTCKGWWHSLSWRYAPVQTKLAMSYQTIGGHEVALSGAVAKYVESFTARSALNVMELGAYYRKVGNPGPLTLAISENPDDLTPGDQVASVTIPTPDLSGYAWRKGTLGAAVALVAWKKYFFEISATGVDTSNYYIFSFDPKQGYGDGIARKQEGSNWTTMPVDIPFRIYVNQLVETTQQMVNLISAYGQFLRRILVESRSGITSESYRSGDTTAKEELEALMEIGTSEYTRILARVELDRSVRIWPQPGERTITKQIEMRSDGKLYIAGGGLVEQHENPVGKWISTSKVIDRANYFGAVAGAQAFFCDRAEWDADGRITTYPANWQNPYSVRVMHG